MLKLAENITKGDIIYLPDEDAWFKVEFIIHVSHPDHNNRYNVWIEGDDIPIYYYATSVVEYKTA